MNLATLDPLKKKEFKQIKFGSFDTEQISLNDRTFRCSALSFLFRDKIKTLYFTDFESMFNKMIEEKFEVIYCFNLKHDEVYFYNYCYENDYEIKSIESGSSLGISVYKGKDCLIKIKDFFPFMLCSLEKACYNYKVKTKKFKVDFDNCSDVEIEKHVRNDAIMLLELMIKYRKTNSVDFMDKSIYSLASLSIKIYRTEFLKNKLENPFVYRVKNTYVINEKLHEFVRKCYKGGLCNNFDREIHYNCVTLDMNSDYPFQTQDEKFPIGRMYRTTKFEEFSYETKEICGFCRVKLYIPDICICSVVDGKLSLIKGFHEVYITSYELKYALECGSELIEFIEGYYSLKFDESFSLAKYMKHYFEKKKTAKSIEERETSKRLINAPSGKLGQKPNQKGIVIKSFENEIEAINNLTETNSHGFLATNSSNKTIVKTEEEHESIKTFMFVSWIAIITAKARIDLLKMIKLTNAYYCDTDSVHIEQSMLKFVPKEKIGSNLGQWKIESKMEYERCLAPKLYASFYDRDYIIEDKRLESELDVYNVKAKGVPSFAQKNLFYEIMEGNESISFECNQNLGYKASFIRKNGVINRDGLFSTIVKKNVELHPKMKEIINNETPV